MGSRSRSSQRQATSYNTETLNSNIQDNSGLALGAVSHSDIDLDITTTDYDSIEKAFEATKNAMVFAENASVNALEFAFNAGAPEAAISQKQLYVGGSLMIASILAYAFTISNKKGKK